MASRFDTVQPADCLEFCPHPYATDIFVCGTYKLNEREGAEADRPLRQGQCLVFSIDRGSTSTLSVNLALIRVFLNLIMVKVNNSKR